jgi:hypothetical protein
MDPEHRKVQNLISKNIGEFVQNCEIIPTVQSKLFDLKAVVLDIVKKPPCLT